MLTNVHVMNIEQNIEGHKLIVEFIGGKVVETNMLNMGKVYRCYGASDLGLYDGINILSLKFHSDWNIMMAVINRINSLAINNDRIYNSDEFNVMKNCPITACAEYTFSIIVEFIKWYNTQKDIIIN